MVDECCCTVLDCIHEAGEDGVLDAFRIQRPIERPPQLLQYLREVFWHGAGDGHATRVGSVKMCVRADVAGHHVLAVRIQRFFIRVFGCERLGGIYFADEVVLNENGMVLENAILFFPSDDFCIRYEHISLNQTGWGGERSYRPRRSLEWQGRLLRRLRDLHHIHCCTTRQRSLRSRFA